MAAQAGQGVANVAAHAAEVEVVLAACGVARFGLPEQHQPLSGSPFSGETLASILVH